MSILGAGTGKEILLPRGRLGTSLVVWWLRVCASIAGDMNLIPGWEVAHTTQGGGKKIFFNSKIAHIRETNAPCLAA